MLKKDKIYEAYKNTILTKGKSESEINESEINEASEVGPMDIPEEKIKLVQSLVGKNQIEKQTYWSGIHGEIVDFNSIYGNIIRVKKNDLKKIMNDKNVRWIDIKAIGF
jgi:hypothetical protein